MSARDTLDELMAFIVERWQHEQRLNRYLGWRALSGWLYAEAFEHRLAGRLEVARDMSALARIAHQFRLDLQPTQEETPAWNSTN